MTDFVQIHFLTAYPAACLVRDDTGRPKTMTFGGVPRGRISSAALKRAIRTSDAYKDQVERRVGKRTQSLGTRIADQLEAEGFAKEETAIPAARTVAQMFGRIKAANAQDPERTEIEQLAFISAEEANGALDIARRLADNELSEKDAEQAAYNLIQGAVTATDIALFGRMFADRPEMRLNAAAEVAHPFTVDRADTEVDYYVAVDDLNKPVPGQERDEPHFLTAEKASGDAGSAFIGEQGFLTGLFYGYANVNKDLLIQNLDGDRALADQAIAAFIQGLATVAPVGKQKPFGTRARASYLRVERGPETPRSLAAAFLSPMRPREGEKETMLGQAIAELEGTAAAFGAAYEDDLESCVMNVAARQGTLRDCIALSQGAPRAVVRRR